MTDETLARPAMAKRSGSWADRRGSGNPRWRLPSLCAVCRSWGDARVCGPCLERFAAPVPRCSRCALPLPIVDRMGEGGEGGEVGDRAADAAPATVCHACIIDRPPFDHAVAAVGYGFPWDSLIPQLKFHAALDLAPTFARLIVAAQRRSAAALPALLLPVPSSRERLRERGFNQAWELARRVASRLACRTDAQLLLRVRDSSHQLGVSLGDRAANVSGAFAIEPRRRSECKGLDIALIDDVMTTGHTASEIARTLRQAGAARVSVWVLARTPRPGDE